MVSGRLSYSAGSDVVLLASKFRYLKMWTFPLMQICGDSAAVRRRP